MNNALLQLDQLIANIEDYRPEVDVSHPVFSHIDWFGMDRDVTSNTLDHVLQEEQVSEAMSTMLKALSRMLIVPTIVSSGLKSIRKIIKGLPGVSYCLVATAESNNSPIETHFVRTLQEAIRIALNQRQAELVPGLTVGFTDSQYVRLLGTDVYGFSALIPDAQLRNRGVHGVDEFTEIDSLILRTKLNVILAYLLLTEDD